MIRMDQIAAVGIAVDAARSEANLSIRKLSEETGIPFVTLRRKLQGRGRSTFDIIQLHLIARVLGRSIASLLPESMR